MLNNTLTVLSKYKTKNIDNIIQFSVKHTFFRNSYFPSNAIEQNSLYKSIRNSKSFSIYKKIILKFIGRSPSRIINCHNNWEVKLFARLSLDISNLRDQNFKVYKLVFNRGVTVHGLLGLSLSFQFVFDHDGLHAVHLIWSMKSAKVVGNCMNLYDPSWNTDQGV